MLQHVVKDSLTQHWLMVKPEAMSTLIHVNRKWVVRLPSILGKLILFSFFFVQKLARTPLTHLHCCGHGFSQLILSVVLQYNTSLTPFFTKTMTTELPITTVL